MPAPFTTYAYYNSDKFHFYGEELMKRAMAYRSFIDAGIIAAAGSDFPPGPRVRVLFEKKLEWIRGEQDLRGCLLQKASLEYNNRLGHPVRERAVHALQDWRELLARCAQTAVNEGHFRSDLDPEQFYYEFEGIAMMYQQLHGLMRDGAAGERARSAFESLLDRSRSEEHTSELQSRP